MNHHFDYHHDDPGNADHHSYIEPHPDDVHHPIEHHPLDPMYPDLGFRDYADATDDNHVQEDGMGAHYAHFNPNYGGSDIIGNPGYDMAQWHQQEHDTTCAVAAQEFILDSYGFHLSEDDLLHEALDHGWYTAQGGTPLDHVGDLLAYHGIPIDRHEGATMTELADRLSLGEKVIVGVNAEDIWYHGSPDDPLTNYPGIPGQNADHAVEVIGIDNADPLHPSVILNDPGTLDGQGIEIPAVVFEEAWATSDHFMVSTTNSITSVEHSGSPALSLGDAQSDKDWADWNAKNADYDASWTEWNAKNAAYDASWAEWNAKQDS